MLTDRHPDDDSQAAQTEREEALWCQVVLFGERIKRLEEQLSLAHELIALQRDKLKIPELIQKPARVQLAKIYTDGKRLRYPQSAEKVAEYDENRKTRWEALKGTGTCVDCGKGISPTSKRCHKHAAVERRLVKQRRITMTPGIPEGFTQDGGSHDAEGGGAA